jgi:hypothetical protein
MRHIPTILLVLFLVLCGLFMLGVIFGSDKVRVSLSLLYLFAMVLYLNHKVEALEKDYKGLVEWMSHMLNQVEALVEESVEDTLAQLENERK